jgi:ABC transporter/Binding-protein-dependent transport system inner membrane component
MIEPADVTLTAVTKRYGSIVAVDSINLTVPKGTYCCLLGPSGCGKTTTLRMIAGHERVSGGEIMLGRQTVNDLPPARRRTAMMFQNYALFPHLKCLDNLAFSLKVGIGLMFNILGWETAWYSSALGAHLTWTLPLGLLIMFAVFNRFDPSYEEAARDLGASGWQTIMGVVVPIIVPSLIGIALFGFTLSYDEFGRTLLTAGVYNSLPLEIYGMTTNITSPALYALGTLTTGFSFGVIAIFVAGSLTLGKRVHLPYDRGVTAAGGRAPPCRRERPGP